MKYLIFKLVDDKNVQSADKRHKMVPEWLMNLNYLFPDFCNIYHLRTQESETRRSNYNVYQYSKNVQN
jgi:hypothetical protein